MIGFQFTSRKRKRPNPAKAPLDKTARFKKKHAKCRKVEHVKVAKGMKTIHACRDCGCAHVENH